MCLNGPYYWTNTVEFFLFCYLSQKTFQSLEDFPTCVLQIFAPTLPCWLSLAGAQWCSLCPAGNCGYLATCCVLFSPAKVLCLAVTLPMAFDLSGSFFLSAEKQNKLEANLTGVGETWQDLTAVVTFNSSRDGGSCSVSLVVPRCLAGLKCCGGSLSLKTLNINFAQRKHRLLE